MRNPTRLLALALLLGACVPEPANRLSQSPEAVASPTATPTAVPTPAGPTPTLSFIRPTPTPQPTFLVYTVAKGDTLTGIAKKFGTSGRSIAYWNRVTYPSLDPDSSKYRPNRLTIGWTLQLIPGSEVDPEDLPTFPPSPTPVTTPEASASPIG